MKKQLLEDFGDSASSLSPPPGRRAPVSAPASAPRTEAAARPRAAVWRSRAPASQPLTPEPRPGAFGAPPPIGAIHPTPPISAPPQGRPEPSFEGPGIAPEIASFSSRQPDWTGPLETDTIPWTERWGRKALGWSLALAGLVAVAGTAAWMVRETKVESSLAIVADHTPAPAAPPTVAAPVVQATPYEPPPLRMLPPEAPAAAPAAATPAAEPPLETAPAATAVAAATAAPEQAKTVPPPPVKKKPAAKPAPERRLAAAAAKRDKPVARKPAKPKAPSERVLARALADAQRSRQESLARPSGSPDPAASQPAATGTLAETLRLCRAAGYHATACMKRGCEATRFGLVCRG